MTNIDRVRPLQAMAKEQPALRSDREQLARVTRVVVAILKFVAYVADLFNRAYEYVRPKKREPILSPKERVYQYEALRREVFGAIEKMESAPVPAWGSDEVERELQAFQDQVAIAMTSLRPKVLFKKASLADVPRGSDHREDEHASYAIELSLQALRELVEEMAPSMKHYRTHVQEMNRDLLFESFGDQPLYLLAARVKYLSKSSQMEVLTRFADEKQAAIVIEQRDKVDRDVERSLLDEKVKLSFEKRVKFGSIASHEASRLIASIEVLHTIAPSLPLYQRASMVHGVIDRLFMRLSEMRKRGSMFDLSKEYRFEGTLFKAFALLSHYLETAEEDFSAEFRLPFLCLGERERHCRFDLSKFSGVSRKVAAAFDKHYEKVKISDSMYEAICDLLIHLEAYETLDEEGSGYEQSNLVRELFRAFGLVFEETFLIDFEEVPTTRSLETLWGVDHPLLRDLDAVHLPHCGGFAYPSPLRVVIEGYRGNAIEQMMIRHPINGLLRSLLGQSAPQILVAPCNFEPIEGLESVCMRLGEKSVEPNYESLIRALSHVRQYDCNEEKASLIDQMGANLTVLEALCERMLRLENGVVLASTFDRMEKLIVDTDHAMHRILTFVSIGCLPPASLPIEALVTLSTRPISDEARRAAVITSLNAKEASLRGNGKSLKVAMLKRIRKDLYQELVEAIIMIQNTLP